MATVEVDDEFRQRLALYFGNTGLATRADVRHWREQNGTSCDHDMFDETQNDARDCSMEDEPSWLREEETEK